MSNGLLQGVSEGLSKGLQGFIGERDRRDKRALAEQEQETKRQILARQIAQDEEESKFKQLGLLDKGIRRVDAGYKPQKGELIDVIGGETYAKAPKSDGMDPYKALQIENLIAGLDKKKFEQTPKGKLEGAGGDVKQKIGFITGAMKSLTDYENQFRGGGRQAYLNQSTPLIGNLMSSTPIDERRTEMEEAIGRLASGGAINVDEEKRFRRMLPTAADDDAAAARKLVQFRAELENKLTAYGFSPNQLAELGFDPKERGYGTEFSDKPMRGLIAEQKGAGLIPEAAASSNAEQESKKRQERIRALKSQVGK